VEVNPQQEMRSRAEAWRCLLRDAGGGRKHDHRMGTQGRHVGMVTMTAVP